MTTLRLGSIATTAVMLVLSLLLIIVALASSPAMAQIKVDQTGTMYLSTADKQAMLDAHNAARRSVTPPSQSMRGLYWNTEIEWDLTLLAQQCPTTTDAFGSDTMTGWFASATTANTVDALPTGTLMGQWLAPSANYSYTSNTCSGSDRKACASYLRIVSESVWWLSCGVASCTNVPVTNPTTGAVRWGPGRAIVCEYSSGFALNDVPYSPGLTCAQCTANFPICDTQLCFAIGGSAAVGAELPDVTILRRRSSTTAMIVGAILGGVLAILLGIYTYCVHKWYKRGMYGNIPLTPYTEVSQGAAANAKSVSVGAAPTKPAAVSPKASANTTADGAKGAEGKSAPASTRTAQGTELTATAGPANTTKEGHPGPIGPTTPRSGFGPTSVAAMNAPLPKNWESHRDDKGREYFYNSITGVSQWTRPS